MDTGLHQSVEIRLMAARHHAGVLQVAEALPEWFDQDARTRGIPVDIRHQHGFVAVADGQVVGFITLFVAEGRLNIGWLGVGRECHGQGIGTRLLEAAEAYAQEHGLAEIATWTLGDGVDYKPYESTRAFYFRRGFVIYQRSQTDNPGCPEEIRIKKAVAGG